MYTPCYGHERVRTMGDFFEDFGLRCFAAMCYALLAWGGLVFVKVGASALGWHGVAQAAAA